MIEHSDGKTSAMLTREKVAGTVSIQRVTFLVGLFLSIAALLSMRSIDRELQAAGGGFGIVSLELAFAAERFSEILDNWGEDLIIQAKRSIYIDFIFIPGYAMVLWALTDYFLTRGSPVILVIGKLLRITPLIAGIFDCVENVLLLQVLERGPAIKTSVMFSASLMAVIKFGLICILLFGWVILYFITRKERHR